MLQNFSFSRMTCFRSFILRVVSDSTHSPSAVFRFHSLLRCANSAGELPAIIDFHFQTTSYIQEGWRGERGAWLTQAQRLPRTKPIRAYMASNYFLSNAGAIVMLQKPDTPDGTVPKFAGWVSRIHLVRSPWKMFAEGRPFQNKTWDVIGCIQSVFPASWTS